MVAETMPAPEARSAPSNDAELSDMALRLEAVLRRPISPPEERTEAAAKPSPPVEPPGRPTTSPLAFGASPGPRDSAKSEPARPSGSSPVPFGAPPGTRDAAKIEVVRAAPSESSRMPPPEPKPVSPKSVFDSLEQEMASLLGRPAGKE